MQHFLRTNMRETRMRGRKSLFNKVEDCECVLCGFLRTTGCGFVLKLWVGMLVLKKCCITRKIEVKLHLTGKSRLTLQFFFVMQQKNLFTLMRCLKQHTGTRDSHLEAFIFSSHLSLESHSHQLSLFAANLFSYDI